MKIAVIGCGVMGSAFADHFEKKHDVIRCDRGANLQEAVKGVDVVLLAVKPKDLKAVSEEIGPVLGESHLLISILAGTPLDMLRKHFPAGRLVRIMPNLPLVCQKGIIALFDSPGLTSITKNEAEDLLGGLGWLQWISEKQADAVTALAGSGPGFVFALMEALIGGGQAIGLSAEDAQNFTIGVMEGAVSLLRHLKLSPEQLKKRVASPGGTTEAGLNALKERGVYKGLVKALEAAYQRGKEMRNSL